MPARPVRNPSLSGRYSMDRSNLACRRMTWRLVRLHSPELSRTWLAIRALSFRGSWALTLASASSRFRLFRFISRASCVSRSLRTRQKCSVDPSLPLCSKIHKWGASLGHRLGQHLPLENSLSCLQPQSHAARLRQVLENRTPAVSTTSDSQQEQERSGLKQPFPTI